MLKVTGPLWRRQIGAEMLMSCSKHLAANLSQLHKLNHAATLSETMPGSIQGKQTCCSTQVFQHQILPMHGRTSPALFAGRLEEQAGPNICLLAPHLQQEWDQAANAHLGSITITAQSGRNVWWSGGMCKTGQPHRWQAVVSNRTGGTGCPYAAGKTVCPCNDLAHNHPEVAAEWDCETNNGRTPETVAARSRFRAAWRCGVCAHRWSATVVNRTYGRGCPQCAHEARRIRSRQPSISVGAPHLVAEWDWEANATHGWHPDQVTLGSTKKVQWVRQDECKLGLVHRWQAAPNSRVYQELESPFPSGHAVCACNSLAVQCPEAADLWDHQANGAMTPNGITEHSRQVVCWRVPDSRQWKQEVQAVVLTFRRHEAKSIK